MSENLQATFQFLAKSENKAALDVLIAGLDYPDQAIRSNTIRALLERRDPTGHREVVRRLSSMDEQCRDVINERPERLDSAVSDALKNPSPGACKAACDAIVSYRLYGVLPALTSVLVDPKTEHTVLLAETALKLTDMFYAELSGADDKPKRKQRDKLRDRITSCLQNAVRKFHRHKRTEVVEALLLVAKSKNATLRQLLQRSQESCHKPILDSLSNSSRGGVIRLLLSFLDDPQMPRAVNNVLFSRCDAKFVENLLWTVGSKPSRTVVRTLSQVASIAWVEPNGELFDKLDDRAQEAAVSLMLASAINRQKVLGVIKYLLLNGKPGGRRAAARALEQFDDPEISDLIVKALDDTDAHVRAALLVQLRPRDVPDSYWLLVRTVDDPEEVIKQALRKAMPEFTLGHFLANFDAMDEEMRPTAGHLVRKIDTDITDRLAANMESPSPVARRRAVMAAGIMSLGQELEETIIELLTDEDHMVRVAAVKVLADCKSAPTWEALRDALLDKSFIVKEAAEQSLEEISRYLLRQSEETEQPQETAP